MRPTADVARPRATRARAFVGLVLALALLPLAGLGGPRHVAAAASNPPPSGYRLVATDGGIFSYGDAEFYGSTGNIKLNKPIVGMASTPSGKGYWLVATDGGIFAFGDAAFYGSTGNIALNKPIVGMASTPSGRGYWLVASDGGIFAFGDAAFYGSTGNIKLNKPIVGMASTPSGRGYWMVASDGGLFNYGDAGFFGSGASKGAGDSFAGLAPSATGKGYRLATAAGQVFPFGDAADLGSARSVSVPIVGIAPAPGGSGYWLVATDGGVYAFGDAGFMGSTRGVKLNLPIVGLAGVPGQPSGPTQQTTSPTTGNSTPTTAPPGPSAPALGTGPEEFVVAKDAPSSGGTPSDQIPSSGTNCGLPSMPSKRVQENNIPFISETSGMAKSQRYNGIYWTVRDFGHEAAVNAVSFDGSGDVLVKEFKVSGASNGDWEEVNYSIGPDGKGRLWVVESGSTSNGQVLEIMEPDPAGPKTATLVNTYPYAYPDGNNQTEASFIKNNRLILLTKTNPHARMYRFNGGLRPGVVNTPTYIGELGNSRDVSMVRQSPDGKLLLTASHDVVHLYRSTDGSGSLDSFNGRFPDCEMKAFPNGAVEAGDFPASREMVFLSEDKTVYRLTLSN